jgi:hypothetical protein
MLASLLSANNTGRTENAQMKFLICTSIIGMLSDD